MAERQHTPIETHVTPLHLNRSQLLTPPPLFSLTSSGSFISFRNNRILNMKWLKKKLSSSSSYSSPSPSSSTASAFPISWASKFKQKRETPPKDKKQTSRFICSPNHPSGFNQSSFCIPDGNWGLSFGEDDNPDAHLQIIKLAQRGNCSIDNNEASVGGIARQESKKPMSVRNEKDQTRKSVYIGGGSQERHSKQGRTLSRRETCKIKALEDMKRGQEHTKKNKAKEKQEKGMESFAVVKHSQDPQHDFRDSMVEMIMEKGIKKPEEMEELLACYLTLNEDEYHDLIIKVFRQVWRELDDMRALNQQLEELNVVFDN